MEQLSFIETKLWTPEHMTSFGPETSLQLLSHHNSLPDNKKTKQTRAKITKKINDSSIKKYRIEKNRIHKRK